MIPNSWELMKHVALMDTEPNTLKRHERMLLASCMFIKLLNKLSDASEALTSYECDLDLQLARLEVSKIESKLHP